MYYGIKNFNLNMSILDENLYGMEDLSDNASFYIALYLCLC